MNASKKTNPVRVVVLLCLLAAAALFFLHQTGRLSLSGKPSERNGQTVLESLIARQSDGAIRVVSFSKTNAREGEILGHKLYEMDYEAEIEFQQSGSWLKGNGMGSTQFGFTRERYGNNSLAQFAASTERGWHAEDGALY